MAKILYLDCFAGLSGDMLLGAIVDAGVNLSDIIEILKGIPISGYEIKEESVKRSYIEAKKVTVSVRGKGGTAKRWKDIKRIIAQARLPEGIKDRGFSIFKSLFEAEGIVHGSAYDEVHLHELGAIDCLIDVFGSLAGLHLLGIDRILSSAVNLGSGTVTTEHGIMPVPAPAVIELLKGVPIYSSGPAAELTTPTGAAILKGVVDEFRPIPVMNLIRRGYGAGTKDFEGFPNVLRIIIGSVQHQQGKESPKSHETFGGISEEIAVIETNIDDMNPQIYEYLFERLFEVGALDVFLTQVIMKKGRPGILLTVLCNEDNIEGIISTLFKETTTLGLRFYRASRRILKREIVEGCLGNERIRIKVARFDGYKKATPEYEDCKRIAKDKGLPLIDIMKETGHAKT